MFTHPCICKVFINICVKWKFKQILQLKHILKKHVAFEQHFTFLFQNSNDSVRKSDKLQILSKMVYWISVKLRHCSKV